MVIGVLAGRITKKYRLNRTVEKLTGISRRHIKYGQKKIQFLKRKRFEKAKLKMNEDIEHFMSRDAKSRMLPGKKDAVKDQKENFKSVF